MSAQIVAMCLYVCSRSMYVCSKSMTGRGFSNIHTCSRGIHTCSRAFFSEFYYNLTWRFLDRGSVFFDFFSLDKPVCPKTPLPVMLFWHTRFKNQRKRYPCRGIVMLCYIVSAQIDVVSMYVCFIFMIKHMVFRHTYIDTASICALTKTDIFSCMFGFM